MTLQPGHSPRLVLWDMDGTLGLRSTASVNIHQLAVERVVGPCPVVPDSGQGMTDSEIVKCLLEENGFPSSIQILNPCMKLLDSLSLEPHRANAYLPLPCVPDALSELTRDGWLQGILTGNTGKRTKSKLSRIDPAETIAWHWVFHDNLHFSREAIAVEAARELHQAATETVIVVGDTPRDVTTAHSQHWLAVAVETGKFNRAQLMASGADHVVSSICEIPSALKMLV